MGNFLCCIGSRKPLDDSRDSGRKNSYKEGERKIIRSKHKAKNKSLTNNSFDTNVKNNMNSLNILTNEIQEKMFTAKDDIKKELDEKNGNNCTKLTLETELRKSKEINEDLVLKSKAKNHNIVIPGKSVGKLDISESINITEITSKNKSFIGGPLKLKNHKKNVEFICVEIFIDNLDMNNFDYEICGPYFQPFLDISFNKEKSNYIKPNGYVTDFFKSENINSSNLSNKDNSFTHNNSNYGSSITNTSKLGNIYHYKTLKKFFIEKKKLENLDINIEFNLKNNCKFKNSESSPILNEKNNFESVRQGNISNFYLASKCNSSFNLNSSIIPRENIPLILIGSNYINLNKFYSELNKKYFDCYLELKLEKTFSIGFLKLIFFINEIDKNSPFNYNNLLYEEEYNVMNKEFSDWIEKNRFDETHKNLNKDIFFNGNSLILWENNFVNMSDLPDLVCEDFFNIEFSFPHEEENNSKINYNRKKSISNDVDSKNNFLQNSFTNFNLNSLNEYKIIGINKKNFKKDNIQNILEKEKNKEDSRNKTENIKEDNLRIICRMKIVDIFLKSRSFIIANEMQSNIDNLNINEELLHEIFNKEIKSKISFKENGSYEINTNYGNKEKINLIKYNMYQFLLILNNLSYLEKYEILIKFFNNLNEEEKIILFEITKFDEFNIYIYRNFLSFMSNFLVHIKYNLVKLFLLFFVFFLN